MGNRMRMMTVALALVLVAPLLVATAAVVSAHDARYDSSVSIRYDRPNFEGRVRSERDFCENNRTVQVFKVRRGVDRLIGQDQTNKNGFYSVRKTGARGRFYAKVVRDVRGRYQHNHICKGDTSGTIRVRRSG